jgi:hypothetical protein
LSARFVSNGSPIIFPVPTTAHELLLKTEFVEFKVRNVVFSPLQFGFRFVDGWARIEFIKVRVFEALKKLIFKFACGHPGRSGRVPLLKKVMCFIVTSNFGSATVV